MIAYTELIGVVVVNPPPRVLILNLFGSILPFDFKQLPSLKIAPVTSFGGQLECK